MAQHLDDHRGIFNGRDEREGVAALWAGGEVDGEDAFESLGPAQAGPR